ncbi:MAG: hypothetical protein HC892_14085 [Saprospiraceae bacterium]|nr:hypothetical protein [Saprospiraceae bacterium]
MRILRPILAILALFLGFACNDNANKVEQLKEQEALYQQVREVHDEVMPKMGELNAITRGLKALSDLPDSLQTNVTAAVSNLENAHEGMMSWMSSLQTLEGLQTKPHEEIITYLSEELVKVEAVKSDMLSSIAAGKTLLEQLTSAK